MLAKSLADVADYTDLFIFLRNPRNQRAIKKSLADNADFTDLFFIFLRNPRNQREKKSKTKSARKKREI